MANSNRPLPAVLKARGVAGEAWASDLQAPIADGGNASDPPQFTNPAPLVAVTGTANNHKLGIGTGEPVHAGRTGLD